MPIASISSIAAISSNTSIQQGNKPVSRPSGLTSSGAATVSSSKSTKPTSTNTTVAPGSSSSTTRSSGGGGAGGSSGGGVSASESAASDLIAAVYTTTVGGKTYTGSVEESDGEYVATVPGLAGASASGASVAAAETALGTIISVLA